MNTSMHRAQIRFRFTRKFVSLFTLALIFSLALVSCGSNGLVGKLFATATPTATPTPQPTPTPTGLSPEVDLLAAIDAAADGDTIHLAAGVFTLPHGFTLEKSLTLIGAGSGQTTLTTGTTTDGWKAAFAFTGSGKLSLKGITLAYNGQSQATVLYVKSGSLELDDCILEGATLSEDGGQLGALNLAGNVQAVIRNSQFAGNPAGALADAPKKVPGGIYVNEEAQLSIEDSQIYDSYRGIIAFDQSNVQVRNVVFRNLSAGVSLLENSTGQVETSQFTEIGSVHLAVSNEAKGTFTGNTLSGSLSSWGFVGQGNGTLLATGNQLSGLKEGFIFYENSTGTVTNNQISFVDGIGVFVSDDASVVLQGNTISSSWPNGEGGEIGILFQENGGGEVSENDIQAVQIGISLNDTSAPALTANTITNCDYGITYLDSAAGSASQNVVDAMTAGISVASPAHPALTDNTVSGYAYSIYTDPESWRDSLELSGNIEHAGPPEVSVATFTPAP